MFIWQTHELYMLMCKYDDKIKFDQLCIKKETLKQIYVRRMNLYAHV